MRIFRSLFFLLPFSVSANCDFKANVHGVVSFAGSSTVLLKELGLLKHKKVKGISVFHPVKSENYQGKVYPGGIFLSQNSLSVLKGNVIFYDESRELKKIFSSVPEATPREVKTRNLTPAQSVDETIKILNEFLHGCEQEVTRIKEKVLSLEKELLKKIPNNLSVVFYLGEFRNGRAPEMVIVNDGVVKWLVEKKKIKTYPSTLAYVNWSAKILNDMPKETLHVGIKDSGRDFVKEIKRSSGRMTLIYPGSLVPGMTQLEAFLYWAQNY